MLEEGLWQSEFRFDTQWMEQVLAADFFEYGRSGRIYQRQDTLNIPYQEIAAQIPLINLKICLIDDRVAQVTYISDVNYDGQRDKALRSSLWSCLSGNWQLRFHQRTPLPIEPLPK
jgi:hypothetical protein